MTKSGRHLPSLLFIFLLPLLLSLFHALLRIRCYTSGSIPVSIQKRLVTHQISEVNEQRRTNEKKNECTSVCPFRRSSVRRFRWCFFSCVFVRVLKNQNIRAVHTAPLYDWLSVPSGEKHFLSLLSKFKVPKHKK
jgi:hypothetical protein